MSGIAGGATILGITRVLLRRWYVVVVVLAVTATSMVDDVPEVHRATARVQLVDRFAIATQATVDETGGDATGKRERAGRGSTDPAGTVSRTGMAAVLVGRLYDDEVRGQILAMGVAPEHLILADEDRGVLDLEVTSADARLSVASIQALVDVTSRELAQLQAEAGAPRSTWISADIVRADTVAEEQLAGKVRAATTAGLAGLVAAPTAALLVEGLARAWRSTGVPRATRRRRSRPARSWLAPPSAAGTIPRLGLVATDTLSRSTAAR